MHESFSDYDDNLPRSAPKPRTLENSIVAPMTLKPEVPEVSVIQGPTNNSKFINFGEKNSSTPNFLPATNYQQFKIQNFAHKISPDSYPIVPNNELFNPEAPKQTVPEVSILFQSSAPLASKTSNHQGMNGLTDQPHSSLPIKSFSSFKRDYQHKIGSFQNYSRNNVLSSNNFCKNDSTRKIGESKPSIVKQCNCSCNSQNSEIDSQNSLNNIQNSELFIKIDKLTNLVQTMYVEMIQIKGELGAFKNNVENYLCTDEKKNEVHHPTELSNPNQFQEYKQFECEESIDNIQELITSTSKTSNNIELKKKDENDIKNELSSVQVNQKDIVKPVISEPQQNKIFDFCDVKTNCISNNLPVIDEFAKPIKTSYRKLDALDPLPENSLLILPNDRSLTMEKLAAKYLPEGKYKIYINDGNNINNGNLPNEIKAPPDMSIASYDYLKKYKLLSSSNENDGNFLFVQDIKKQPKYI